MKINPNRSAELYETRASFFLGNKQYKEAISDYEKAITLGVSDPILYFSLGRAYAAENQYSKSNIAYRKSLKAGGENISAIYYNKGLNYTNLEKYSEALKNYTLYIKAQPTDPDGYIMRAITALSSESRDIDAALQDIDKAIDLECNNVNLKTYKLRSKILREAGDLNGAISDISNVIKQNRSFSNLPYYIQSAYLYAELNDIPNAMLELNKIVFADSDSPNSYQIRAEFYAYIGDYLNALPDLNKAISLDDKRPDLYKQRSSNCYSLENFSNAIIEINIAISLKEDDPDLYYLRAEILIENEDDNGISLTINRREKAIEDYSIATKLNSKNPNYFEARGLTNFLLRNYEDSVSDYSSAIDLKADKYNLYASRAKAYLSLGNNKDACIDLEVAESNGYSEANNLFSSLCSKKDGKERILPDNNKDLSDIYWLRSFAKHREGDIKGAIKDLSLAIDANSNNTRALNSRSIRSMELGDIHSALADSNKELLIDPNDYLLHFQKGRILLELENFFKASESFENSIDLNPNHIKSRMFAGFSKRKFGDILDACKNWRRALELGSEDACDVIESSCEN